MFFQFDLPFLLIRLLFLKFNQAYKEKLDEVIKEKKLTDLFEQCDEALKRVKKDDACRNV